MSPLQGFDFMDSLFPALTEKPVKKGGAIKYFRTTRSKPPLSLPRVRASPTALQGEIKRLIFAFFMPFFESLRLCGDLLF